MDADIASLIGQIPLFASLPGTELRFLASLLDRVQIPPGTLLFREGEPGDYFYLIVDGEIEVIKALGTPDERIIATRRTGDFFGEMSLFEPSGRRTASVRARTPLCLLQMARADFDVLLQRRPILAYEMVRVLSLRLGESHNTTIADLREKNRQLAQAYEELKAAQAQIIEKERLEKELETAHWIQQSILPHTLPSHPGFGFGALLTPARAVGGDLFGFIPLPDDRIAVAIGDVSDKGVPAAIFMALTYSLLRAEAIRWPSPADVLQATNHQLLGMNEAGMFVTVLYGVLDCRNGRFRYARAGHELPLHFSPAGEVVPSPFGVGQPLGLFEDPFLDEQSIEVEPGGSLLMYTDGATDLTDPWGDCFGPERLRAAARASRDESAQAFCDRLWAALTQYQGSSTQFDDVALVAIQAKE
jgi:sigma-B regulation protein RsbU (phosphoserine phosphatase)